MSTKAMEQSNVPTVDHERAAMSSEQLRIRIADRFLPTAVNLMELSLDWAELERRGYDLTDLRRELSNCVAEWLPLIAARRIAPEAVVAFSGRKIILKHFDGMSLDLQRRLADGEEIPVYLPGDKMPACLPLARINMAVLPRLIKDGKLLTPKEQRVARVMQKPSPPLQRKHSVQVDRETRRMKIGNTEVSTATVVAAMAEAAGARGKIIDSVEAPACVIGGKFTDEERDRLRLAAKVHNMAEWEMVRQAVIAMWLL